MLHIDPKDSRIRKEGKSHKYILALDTNALRIIVPKSDAADVVRAFFFSTESHEYLIEGSAKKDILQLWVQARDADQRTAPKSILFKMGGAIDVHFQLNVIRQLKQRKGV